MGSDTFAVTIEVDDMASDEVLASAPEGFHLGFLNTIEAWSRIRLHAMSIHPDVQARGLSEMFTVRALEEAWTKREQSGTCPILEACTFDELLMGQDAAGNEIHDRFAISIDVSDAAEEDDAMSFAAVVPSAWVAGIDKSQSFESRAFE